MSALSFILKIELLLGRWPRVCANLGGVMARAASQRRASDSQRSSRRISAAAGVDGALSRKRSTILTNR